MAMVEESEVKIFKDGKVMKIAEAVQDYEMRIAELCEENEKLKKRLNGLMGKPDELSDAEKLEHCERQLKVANNNNAFLQGKIEAYENVFKWSGIRIGD